jgi:hypothetical protein
VSDDAFDKNSKTKQSHIEKIRGGWHKTCWDQQESFLLDKAEFELALEENEFNVLFCFLFYCFILFVVLGFAIKAAH